MMKIRSSAFTKALKNELDERKFRLLRLKKERESEVYSRIPSLRAVDEGARNMAYDLGRQIMGAKNADELGAAAAAAIDDRLNERRRLLLENGYPADYLEPEYICPECRDTGRIGDELCRCVTPLALKTAFSSSGLNHSQNFESFDLELQKDPRSRTAMKKILDQAIAYANGFPHEGKTDIIYVGMTGVGKTYLLNCIGCRGLERGFSVLRFSASRLIELTMETLRSAPEDRPDFILPELLIIDDLGTEPMIPNITVETLLSIVCQRQDSGKATLFATNLSLSSNDPSESTLQDFYGERLSSRLMAPNKVKLQLVMTDNVRLSV